MSIITSKMDKEEDYRRLSLNILSQLNVIKIHERGDYYKQAGDLSDDLVEEAIKIAKDNIACLDAKAFKSILLNVYKEAGIETGDEHFNN